MNATDGFNLFHERRERERETERRERLSIRKAVLPGDLHGYVLRRGETERRAYVTRAAVTGWSYGELIGRDLLHRGYARTKDVAVARAGLLI